MNACKLTNKFSIFFSKHNSMKIYALKSSNSNRMDNINHTFFQNIVILYMVIRLLSSQLCKLWKFV